MLGRQPCEKCPNCHPGSPCADAKANKCCYCGCGKQSTGIQRYRCHSYLKGKGQQKLKEAVENELQKGFAKELKAKEVEVRKETEENCAKKAARATRRAKTTAKSVDLSTEASSPPPPAVSAPLPATKPQAQLPVRPLAAEHDVVVVYDPESKRNAKFIKGGAYIEGIFGANYSVVSPHRFILWRI